MQAQEAKEESEPKAKRLIAIQQRQRKEQEQNSNSIQHSEMVDKYSKYIRENPIYAHGQNTINIMSKVSGKEAQTQKVTLSQVISPEKQNTQNQVTQTIIVQENTNPMMYSFGQGSIEGSNFIGRKRKKSDEDYNEESDKDNNIDEGEIESNPIINIKNSDNENPSPKNKKNGKNSNSNNANNQIKKSPSNKSSQNNEKKLENILENMGDKNDKNDKNQNQEEKEMNNSNDSDNNKENDTNNNYIENDDDAYLEEYKKRQHEIKLSEELIKSYSYKIAKKLDKLNDEDMFDLIEFIERIKPDAIDDTGNLLNIDMTKFEGETYISVLNFVENAILNNSMYK